MQLRKKTVPILMYHSISSITSAKFRQFTVSPVSFAEQLAYLKQHAYTPMTVTQFVEAMAQDTPAFPERPVILTFDDGFADFFTAALPLLRRYDFPATLYISTAFINGTSRWLRIPGETARPMLSWEQLAAISIGRIECGAHSHSHPQLDILPLAAARDEIVRSKQILEDHLGKEVSSFAYPFGYYTNQVRQLVQEAGYTSACAVKHAMSSASDDPFSLTRLMVRTGFSIEEFAALLIGHSPSPGGAVYSIYARARTPLWHLVRRCKAMGVHSITKDGIARC